MTCYYPIQGWRSASLNENGKRPIVFNVRDGYADMPVTVPCGRCIGCRLDKSKQWAIRCMHEASLHEDNCFITLTYSDDNLPRDLSLDKTHFKNFMKRLRRRTGVKMSYYHCGEYGSETFRPHYHALLFGYDFSDRQFYSSNSGNPLFTSKFLSDVWGYGHCFIGDVSFESAAYVARYILKKVTGEAAVGWYTDVDVDTGEMVSVQPEYATMSLNPAIGKRWLEKYKTDVFPDDFVIVKGKKLKVPRYYDDLLASFDPALAEHLKRERNAAMKRLASDNTISRLRVKETVKEAQLAQLKRKIK